MLEQFLKTSQRKGAKRLMIIHYNMTSTRFNLPVLSKDRLEPCRLGGLLPGRLCGLLAGRLAGRLPVSPALDFRTVGVEALRTGVLEYGDDSLSLSESGVPAVRFTPILPIGTLLELRSRTYTPTTLLYQKQCSQTTV